MERRSAHKLAYGVLSGMIFVGCQVSCSDSRGSAHQSLTDSNAEHSWNILVYDLDRIESLDITSGRLTTVLTANPGEESGSLGMASLSPDASKIAFMEQTEEDEDSLVVYSLIEKTRQVLFKMPYLDSPRWSPDGRTIAVSGRRLKSGAYSLYLYSLDDRKLTTLVEGQLKDGEMVFSWAPDGKKIVYQDAVNAICIFDFTKRVYTRIDAGWFPTWSPSGRYIAYRSDDSGDPGYLIYDLQTASRERILRGASAYRSLIWSPDSRYLIYAADGRGDFYGDLFVLDLRTKKAKRVLRLQQSVYPTDWAARPKESVPPQ